MGPESAAQRTHTDPSTYTFKTRTDSKSNASNLGKKRP